MNPEKKNPLFSFLNLLGQLILLSILWTVCCLPIITVGASTVALYYTVVKVLRRNGETWVLSVTICQGLNRQIRRMCAQTGLSVRRLRRVREGSLLLGDLPLGKWRVLTKAETAALLGEKGTS